MITFPDVRTLYCQDPLADYPEVVALSKVRLVVFDFDGVFTDNSVYVDQNGSESVRCSRLDGFGLAALRSNGVVSFVLSTEKNSVVSARCKKLRIDCYSGIDDKGLFLSAHLKKVGISPENVAYAGNDINDIDCLTMVGFPIIVADSHPSVFRCARYITKSPGGHGAVREICDFIVAATERTKLIS